MIGNATPLACGHDQYPRTKLVVARTGHCARSRRGGEGTCCSPASCLELDFHARGNASAHGTAGLAVPYTHHRLARIRHTFPPRSDMDSQRPFVVSGSHGVVAAGHAATYVLHHAAHRPGTIARAALIAPTWRGPLPTMGGGQRPLFQAIRRAVETPYVGPLLYRLNVNPFVVRKMVAGHVYSDANWLTGERLAQKCRVIDAAGARFASAAFVTGALDPVARRAEFLALALQLRSGQALYQRARAAFGLGQYPAALENAGKAVDLPVNTPDERQVHI